MSKVSHPNFVKSIIHKSLDFLFPLVCLGCRQEGKRLCLTCLNTLPHHWSSNGDDIISVFDYQNATIKQAIWALKYKRALDLAEIFAWPLHETLVSELAEQLTESLTKIILVPVPLFPRRQKQRGYNQAGLLAQKLISLDPDKFEIRNDLVIKIKNTPTQVSLQNRAARLNNLVGAFVLTKQIILPADKIIVIIDDVASTGATINEVRQTLRPLSQRKIYGLTLARG